MTNSGVYKECPFCRERIRHEAIKCRYCGEFLDSQVDTRSDSSPRSSIVTVRIPPHRPFDTPTFGFQHGVSEEGELLFSDSSVRLGTLSLRYDEIEGILLNQQMTTLNGMLREREYLYQLFGKDNKLAMHVCFTAGAFRSKTAKADAFHKLFSVSVQRIVPVIIVKWLTRIEESTCPISIPGLNGKFSRKGVHWEGPRFLRFRKIKQAIPWDKVEMLTVDGSSYNLYPLPGEERWYDYTCWSTPRFSINSLILPEIVIHCIEKYSQLHEVHIMGKKLRRQGNGRLSFVQE